MGLSPIIFVSRTSTSEICKICMNKREREVNHIVVQFRHLCVIEAQKYKSCICPTPPFSFGKGEERKLIFSRVMRFLVARGETTGEENGSLILEKPISTELKLFNPLDVVYHGMQNERSQVSCRISSFSIFPTAKSGNLG